MSLADIQFPLVYIAFVALLFSTHALRMKHGYRDVIMLVVGIIALVVSWMTSLITANWMGRFEPFLGLDYVGVTFILSICILGVTLALVWMIDTKCLNRP